MISTPQSRSCQDEVGADARAWHDAELEILHGVPGKVDAISDGAESAAGI
jgi:hypothetical protein